MIDVVGARQSPQLRERFLEELVRDYTPKIYSLIAQRGTMVTIDEAKQAFLVQANRAIDNARLVDDGRGFNDPRLWCGSSGLGGVREVIRTKMRQTIRETKTLVKATEEQQEALFGTTRDIADLICGDDVVSKFMLLLTAPEREVVKLLLQGYGPRSRLERASRTNYIKQLSEVTGWKIYKIVRIIASLRKKASYLHG